MITVASVAISLTIGLDLQYAHGQSDNLTDSYYELKAQHETFDKLINYCYQHADRPNPLQDLIDKGFLPSTLNGTGINCLVVKHMDDNVQNEMTDIQTKIDQANAKPYADADKYDCTTTHYWWCK
jgi:hypothetical protein